MSISKFSVPIRWDFEFNVLLQNSQLNRILGKGHGLSKISVAVPMSSHADIEVDANSIEDATELALGIANQSPADLASTPQPDDRGDCIVQPHLERKHLDVTFINTHPNFAQFNQVSSDSALQNINDDYKELLINAHINSDHDVIEISSQKKSPSNLGKVSKEKELEVLFREKFTETVKDSLVDHWSGNDNFVTPMITKNNILSLNPELKKGSYISLESYVDIVVKEIENVINDYLQKSLMPADYQNSIKISGAEPSSSPTTIPLDSTDDFILSLLSNHSKNCITPTSCVYVKPEIGLGSEVHKNKFVKHLSENIDFMITKINADFLNLSASEIEFLNPISDIEKSLSSDSEGAMLQLSESSDHDTKMALFSEIISSANNSDLCLVSKVMDPIAREIVEGELALNDTDFISSIAVAKSIVANKNYSGIIPDSLVESLTKLVDSIQDSTLQPLLKEHKNA
jgi:hypothetical protein